MEAGSAVVDRSAAEVEQGEERERDDDVDEDEGKAVKEAIEAGVRVRVWGETGGDEGVVIERGEKVDGSKVELGSRREDSGGRLLKF